MHRSDHAKWDDSEEVLLMLKCPHCDKNSVYWVDGSIWEHRKTHCPKCQAVMDMKDTERVLIIATA
jgi:acetyl-CoA carboxylase beta subunit